MNPFIELKLMLLSNSYDKLETFLIRHDSYFLENFIINNKTQNKFLIKITESEILQQEQINIYTKDESIKTISFTDLQQCTLISYNHNNNNTEMKSSSSSNTPINNIAIAMIGKTLNPEFNNQIEFK